MIPFVPFVREASGPLGPEAGVFLEYLQSICSFPILRAFPCPHVRALR